VPQRRATRTPFNSLPLHTRAVQSLWPFRGQGWMRSQLYARRARSRLAPPCWPGGL